MSNSLKLFLAASASAAFYAFFGPAVPIRGGGEMVAIGLSLAQRGVYGHPFALTLDTGPTAVVPPLYPGLIGALAVLLGNSAAWIVLAGGVILVQGLHVSLLPRLARIFYGDSRPGFCAAALCVALPVYSWMPHWDAIYTATGLMLLCVASYRWSERGWPWYRLAVVCGLWSGVLALANPSSMMLSIPWLFFLLGGRGATFRQIVRFGACFGTALLLVVLPWSLRNYRRIGTLSLRTNLGMTLFASNNDCATPSLYSGIESGCYLDHHPYGSFAEADLLKKMGEPAYDRDRIAAASAWASAHPGRFLRLTSTRFVQFWFPSPEYGIFARCIWLVTALSVPGLWLMRRNRWVRFVAAALLVYPCLYYVVVSDYRYRYPILWLSLLPAGYAIHTVLANCPGRFASPRRLRTAVRAGGGSVAKNGLAQAKP